MRQIAYSQIDYLSQECYITVFNLVDTVVTNMDVLMQMYPSHRKEGNVYFILGTYLEQVYKEGMVKEKELLVNTSAQGGILAGSLGARFPRNH